LSDELHAEHREGPGDVEAERFWEDHYRQRGRVWSGRPNPVLADVVGSLRPGTALDLGSGEGGDAIWLARQGWRVTAVRDYCEAGAGVAPGILARTQSVRPKQPAIDCGGGGARMSVEDHYEKLLARHYSWMHGDYDSKVRKYQFLFEQAGILPRSVGKALDLGSGSGFQSLALADLGFEVLSVDTSELLLRELRDRAGGRDVRTVLGDMRESGTYANEGPFEVAVCMGDTLPHLQSYDEVKTLFDDVLGVLEGGGALVLEFRDATRELEGVDRAIPLRMDDERIMATFLEYEADRVNVHDMVFVRGVEGWSMHKSAYTKLRLGEEKILNLLGRTGFRIVSSEEDRGFVTVVARA
jgi:SAM-dependent methyltransferase